MKPNDNSHLTAISRSVPSLPLRCLLKKELIESPVLDYGSGKGMDFRTLKELGFDAYCYDPYYSPQQPTIKFRCVLCTYVLNVVQKPVRAYILKAIDSLLLEGGVAFITVTRWCRQPKWTAKGTFQDYVELDLPVIYQDGKMCIYEYHKNYENR